MTTNKELQDFAVKFFNAVDNQNSDKLRPYFTTDIVLRMANMPPIEGINEVVEAFKATEERFSSIKHFIEGIWLGNWEEGPVVSVEAIARYEFSEGENVDLPVTSTLRLTRENQVSDYRIFMDPLPAFR